MKLLFVLLFFLLFTRGQDVNAKVVSIAINPPRELDFKTRKEVFSVRKKMLKKYAFFTKDGYSTQGAVYAQVEDNKPWWGLQGIECKGNGEHSIDGASEESRFIDNPFLLVGIDQEAYSLGKNAKCSGRYPKPSNLKFDTNKKLISVSYGLMPDDRPYRFTGQNARDLGFKFGYAEKSNGIEFLNNNNISSDVYEFLDFLHVGGSCGYPGGCNNGSPSQPQLSFTVPKKKGNIRFKLWKKRPASKDEKADLTYEIKIH